MWFQDEIVAATKMDELAKIFEEKNERWSNFFDKVENSTNEGENRKVFILKFQRC
jgi:hypothetical protein